MEKESLGWHHLVWKTRENMWFNLTRRDYGSAYWWVSRWQIDGKMLLPGEQVRIRSHYASFLVASATNCNFSSKLTVFWGWSAEDYIGCMGVETTGVVYQWQHGDWTHDGWWWLVDGCILARPGIPKLKDANIYYLVIHTVMENHDDWR